MQVALRSREYINQRQNKFIKGSLDEKLPSYEVLKMLKE